MADVLHARQEKWKQGFDRESWQADLEVINIERRDSTHNIGIALVVKMLLVTSLRSHFWKGRKHRVERRVMSQDHAG